MTQVAELLIRQMSIHEVLVLLVSLRPGALTGPRHVGAEVFA